MFRRFLPIAAVLGVLTLAPVQAAQAPAPKSLGTFGVWQTFALNDKGSSICYMALKTRGTALKSKKAHRGPVILMITERPTENTRDVVSYAAGYNFKAASDLHIVLGKTNFSLFTQKDTAWSRDAMTDHALTMAIIKTPSLVATGTPDGRGEGNLQDGLALKGAADAYRAIGKACGITVDAPIAPPAPHKKHAS